MLHKELSDCPQFVAGDKTSLREVLHPLGDDLPLRYSLAHAELATGECSLPHALGGSEVYHFLAGTGMMHVAGEEARVSAGDTVYVPPGARQYVCNNGASTLSFLCIVDPPWRAEDESVEG